MSRWFTTASRRLAATASLIQTPHLIIPPYIPIMESITKPASARRLRKSMPAVLMRAGTSKGLFIHRAHLPPSESDWAEPLLAAMGSRYSDPRQLDGLGGATSVTSKVAVVAPSARPGIDVDYTFVQVAVGNEKVDLSGNCGNMVSGVGPFAVQERLVTAEPGTQTVDVRIFNTNTSRVIVETVSVDEHGELEEDGDCTIPGVLSPGSAIKVAFIEPAGSMTGKLFPSGKRTESIYMEGVAGLPPFTVDVTLADAANPFVLVDSRTLPIQVRERDASSQLNMDVAEAIRQQGAVRMGLAVSPEAAALVRGTPKLAIVSRPADPKKADIYVQAYSMGKPHPSLQLTGGVCLASAACMEGTVLYRLSSQSGEPLVGGVLTPRRTPSPVGQGIVEVEAEEDTTTANKDVVRIQHSRGAMDMEVWKRMGEEGIEVERCIGVRTARRLFEGNVLYYA